MPARPAATPRLVACCLALLLAGCATTGERNPDDPLEPVNRELYEFNTEVDKVTLKPVAKVYDEEVPDWMKTSVSNFFYNLGLPWTIVNQLLQLKLKEAGQDTLRFAMNTTLGIGGLFDPAADANLPRHEEDLGQTLGYWGVPPGPYLMLPLLGPSHLRDVPSMVGERFLEPFYWYSYGSERWISLGVSTVDKRAKLLPLEPTLERTYDPYAFIREAYSQRRLFQVYDGDIPPDKLPKEEEFEDEDWPEDEAPADDEPARQAPTDAGPAADQPAD